MNENNLKSSFTPSNLNKRTVTALDELKQNFAQIPKTDKEDLIINNLKLDLFSVPIPIQINISEILSPSGFTRHKNDPFEDLECLEKPGLIKVVRAKNIKGYFLVDDELKLEFYKNKDETNKISVLIVGQVLCQSQIAMIRAKTMIIFKRSPNTMELVQGIVSLYEIILTDFGKDAFYSHGGNRKNETTKKQSLSEYISNVLNLKQSTVNALLNFGNYVDPYGLSGLHYHKDMQTLSIRKINQINAKLKKENLSKKIREMASKIRETKATESEIIKTCGNLARNIIVDCIADLDGQNTSTNEDDSDAEEFDESEFDLSDYDLPPEQKKSSKKQNGESYSDNDDEDDNFKDEIKDSLKLLKRLKHLLPNFEKLLQAFVPSEITTQGKLIKNLKEFNDNGEDFISLITKLMTDIKIGN